MDIPVHIGDTFQAAMLQRMQTGDGTVAEDAESHAHIRLGMVTRGSDQRIAIVNTLVEQRIREFNHATCSEQSDIIRPDPHRGALAGFTSGFVQGFDLLQIRRFVKQHDFRFCRWSRRDRNQLFGETGNIHQVLEPPFGLRVFRVLVGLYREARWHDPGVFARVVPHVELMPDQSCFARHTIPRGSVTRRF